MDPTNFSVETVLVAMVLNQSCLAQSKGFVGIGQKFRGDELRQT